MNRSITKTAQASVVAIACLLFVGSQAAHAHSLGETRTSTQTYVQMVSDSGTANARSLTLTANGITASAAARIAAGHVGGTVLSVNRRGNAFVVKVQKPNRVVTVRVNAQTGGILSVRGQ